jgi:hypothetical protein
MARNLIVPTQRPEQSYSLWIERKCGFIAVYAGETEEEARRFLAEVKAGQFADANLRRMQAVVTYQLE